jgi:ABC-2 type transport system permease protein
MPNSHAIAVAETLPSGVVVTPLFTTSDKANRVSVSDTSVTLSTAGKQHVAVAAVKSIPLDDGTTDTAHITWYGSAEAFTDKYAEATSGGNYYYFAATLSFMSESFSSAYENLSAVPLTGESLSGLTNGAVVIIGLVTVILLPVGLLVTGIVIWVKRKRR